MALPALLANYVNYGNGSSTGYYAVATWASLTAVAAGVLRRQLVAPSVGNERVFVCIIAGTTLMSEPSWTVTRGAKTAEAAGPTWQECTGQPATNGDLTNTYTWSASKTAASTPSLGVIVKDASNNLFICTTSGAVGASEPTWNTTIGNTTTDASAVWTCISNGAYGNWAAPHARLANAFASNWGAAGDTFYIAGSHAETQSTAMTLTCPGTVTSPCRILCVTESGSVPPVLATTATVKTSGNNSLIIDGCGYIEGTTFTAGDSSGTANLIVQSVVTRSDMRFRKCALRLGGTGISSKIRLVDNTGADGFVLLDETTMQFGATGQGLAAKMRFMWQNTASAITGATIPTTLLLTSVGEIDFLGVDLSALGSGKNLMTASNGTTATVRLSDCRLGASVSVTTGSITAAGALQVEMVNCDSVDTNYRYYRQAYHGTITQETTIVRTGGASDGTTTFSRKMVTTANSKFYAPLVGPWFRFWNDATGSPITVNAEVVTDNVTLTDNEAWIEIEGLTTSGFPLGGFVSDAAADVLATGTNQPTSSETWTTTGLTTPVKQTLGTSITPQEKGWIRARICLAKASTTMYVCPKVQSSSGSQLMDDSGDILNLPAAAAGGERVTFLVG